MKNILLSCSLLGMFFANAQVATIEEDFSSFSSQAFPQNGWNKSDLPEFTRFEPNQYIRTYSLFGTDPVYIITPELISIDGIKSLKFETWGTSIGDVQIGVTSDPNTANIAKNFKPVSQLYPISTSTHNTYEVKIPKSDAKYIVFKLMPAGPHTSLRLDNIYYKEHSLSTSEITNKSTPKFAVDNTKNKIIFADNNIQSIKIFSANGSLISNEKVLQNQVNISKLNSGVYFIILEDNNGNITKSKFIKK